MINSLGTLSLIVAELPKMDEYEVFTIAVFDRHTIIKTIQQIKSRIQEVREDEYSNSLAKIQVCAMFRAGDIPRNVLLKFIRLCKETPCLGASEGHKYGGRKLTKTCHRACSCLLWAHKHLREYLFSYKDCSDCKISAHKSLFLSYVTAFSAAILISCHAKA